MTMMFGESWESPIPARAAIFPVAPTYAACCRCREKFEEGDQGIILAHLGPKAVPAELLVGMFGNGGVLVGQHRECHIASIIGHLVGVCPCTGWKPDSRETAREATRRWECQQRDGRFTSSFRCSPPKESEGDGGGC